MADKKALIVWGGWDGHQPEQVAEIYRDTLTRHGFDVAVSDTLDAYRDGDKLKSLDLIVPIWTMGKITNEQLNPLLAAVKSGVGLSGCHGGMCDSFRDATEYQFMTGGQWVAHPGNDGVEYTGQDHRPCHFITQGVSAEFPVKSEQYYMHVDPAGQSSRRHAHADRRWTPRQERPVRHAGRVDQVLRRGPRLLRLARPPRRHRRPDLTCSAFAPAPRCGPPTPKTARRARNLFICSLRQRLAADPTPVRAAGLGATADQRMRRAAGDACGNKSAARAGRVRRKRHSRRAGHDFNPCRRGRAGATRGGIAAGWRCARRVRRLSALVRAKVPVRQLLGGSQNLHPNWTNEQIDLAVRQFVAAPAANPACPPPHRTGGAVDVFLVDASTGPEPAMGTAPDEVSPASATRWFEEHMQEPFTTHRRLLFHAMTGTGFTNYRGEWWHYDFGNQRWANITGADYAIYGAAPEESEDTLPCTLPP
jgi:type 1 glutamine amidotransferase